MLVICTEAGSRIGYGHLTRCEAIRNYWAESGGQVRMIVYTDGEEATEPHISLGNWIADGLNGCGIDEGEIKAILVDSYLAQPSVYERLCRIAPVAALDDYRRIDYPTDLVINPNVFGDTAQYRPKARGRFVGGPRYVILRKEIRDALHETYPEEEGHGLLLVGGSDYRKLLPHIVPSLLGQFRSLTVIAGSDLYRDALRDQLPAKDALVVRGRLGADEMAREYKRAQIVVSACGQTLHELAYLGKPTVGICVDIDQRPNQASYLQLGFLSAEIQWDDTGLLSLIDEELHRLSKPTERRRRARIGQGALDGYGAERICKMLKELCG